MRFVFRSASLLAAALLLVACGRGPAEQAIKAADAALLAARPEIEKYVPSDFTQLTQGLASAKAQFQRGDYKGALASAQDLVPKVQAAVEAAKKKKDELITAFTQLKASVPGMKDALSAQLAALASEKKKMPAGLDMATVEAAQSNLAGVTKTWNDALASFDKGDVILAVDQANKVKAAVEEAARAFPTSAPKK
jgi:hypothetical protein